MRSVLCDGALYWALKKTKVSNSEMRMLTQKEAH